MKLRAPLKVAQVAELLSSPGDTWSAKRTRRWLQELEERTGVLLLVGHPAVVTLAALARACPDIFEAPPGIEAQLEEVQAIAQRLEERQDQTATALGVLRRQITSQQRPEEPSRSRLVPEGPRRGVRAA